MKKIIYYLLCGVLLLSACEKDSPGLAISVGGGAGQGGSLARFAIVGNYLYSVDDRNLKVFNITNAENPVLEATQNVGFSIETIYPFKDKLFIGSATEVYIFSIADPAKPQKLSSAISPQVITRCDPVVAKDTVAFATLRTNGPCGGLQSVLAVYNIKDITNPIQTATYPVGEPYGLGYSGDVLYVCDKWAGLVLFDISQPYQPTPINISINDGTYIDVIPYGTTLICWVTTGIILYDITDNRNPVLIAKIN